MKQCGATEQKRVEGYIRPGNGKGNKGDALMGEK